MLTNRAKYAIKALLHLARRRGQGPVQASVIAEAEQIPHKFLEVILTQLRNRGVIRSKVGKGGGHELVNDPADIDLLTVMRAIDGPVAPLPCLSHTAYVRCDDCADEATCGARMLLMRAHEIQVKELSRTTLGDALTSEPQGQTARRRQRKQH
ncbi:MAG: Rrf2 family transcriptional regulator [Planctomycetes bacterium]|nr:Rrf2 family transcriptional regulator [Planctomycetota bacterium]